MKMLLKPVLLAGLSLAATAPILATPAVAQVNGIATSSPEAALVQASALQSGYQAINTANANQRQQINTLRTEINNLQLSLNTNGDREVDQAEWDANPGVTGQIEAKEQQLQTLLAPIAIAEYYVVEQLLMRYGEAQSQVITSNGIQIMVEPAALQYSVDGVDVTQKIVAALNTLVPTVSTTPPANWQPRRQTVETHQAIQQIIVGIAQRQAAQAAQQQTQQQPSGR
ncbi:OmpH family outer membrane protein [Parerythrobacter lacustris]|uniref:OmpH family outer membrane protein n=1 Tax=Parerythrobacter lacustris TaxID=2969984 RepID=A0ABT1XQA5_9SPHN|nr:OmpH family outer membrane protein [Parerythrobacter lacustris]MCR2833422.1 OmpH family outer membrane protein [Parerythrobacter lacustris]